MRVASSYAALLRKVRQDDFPFEYTAKPERVFLLGSVTQTSLGTRVRYRKPGTRLWTKVLLVDEHNDLEVRMAILKHAENAAVASPHDRNT